MIIAGIMTGTSLDGVDCAVVDFKSYADGTEGFETLFFETLEYPAKLKNSVLDIINGTAGVKEICSLNFAIAQLYSESLQTVCKNNNFDITKIRAVGAHGQTIWHEPTKIDYSGFNVASTLQALSGSALAMDLCLPVVYDFRAADIALGGQGAPLVPMFDYTFLSERGRDCIALNIGGISNITFLPFDLIEEKVKAFDCGPGVALIDYLANRFWNVSYDKNGYFAASGEVIERLFDLLKKDDYITAKPPKSTGREKFNKDYINKALKDSLSENEPPENIIHTFSCFTAYCIARNIELFASPKAKIIASGGGVKNYFLIDKINEYLPKAELFISDEIGVPSDAKEAIAFAYLAYRYVNGEHGNLPSVTGAKAKVRLGSWAMP